VAKKPQELKPKTVHWQYREPYNFLLTYGWGIFVVLMAIGTLWYFGESATNTPITKKCCEQVCCGLDAEKYSVKCCPSDKCNQYGNFQDLGGHSILCNDGKRITGMTTEDAQALCRGLNT
jgi:hypothetical protein